MQYIKEKPGALLIRPNSASVNLDTSITESQQLSSTILPTTLDDITLGEEDLATYLFPRILRATSSLEAALLSSDKPDEERNDTEALTWRARDALKNQLEELLVKIVVVLAESALGVEWMEKNSIVQGGVGKAREMTTAMIKLLECE